MFLKAQDGTIHNIDDPATIINMKARGYMETDEPKKAEPKKAEPKRFEAKAPETAPVK